MTGVHFDLLAWSLLPSRRDSGDDNNLVILCDERSGEPLPEVARPEAKTIYQLSDQNLAQPYAAEKVQVTGRLDAATKTIQVTGIKVLEDDKRS